METNAQQLEAWGISAASAYLVDQKALMTDTIEKIATENLLNKEQIQRVCEFANHKAYEELTKTATDKRFEFPLADVNDIVNRIKDVPDLVVNPVNTNDWGKLAFVKEDMNINPFMIGEVKDNLVKTAQSHLHKQPTMDEKVGAYVKLAEVEDKLRSAEVEYESDQYHVKNAMKKVVKDLMDDGHSFEDLYKTAVASNPEKADSIKGLFQDMANDMKLHVKLATDMLLAKAYMMKKMAEIQATPRDIKYLKGKNDLTMAITEWNRLNDEVTSLKQIQNYTDAVRETAKAKIVEEEFKNKNPKPDGE